MNFTSLTETFSIHDIFRFLSRTTSQDFETTSSKKIANQIIKHTVPYPKLNLERNSSVAEQLSDIEVKKILTLLRSKKVLCLAMKGFYADGTGYGSHNIVIMPDRYEYCKVVQSLFKRSPVYEIDVDFTRLSCCLRNLVNAAHQHDIIGVEYAYGNPHKQMVYWQVQKVYSGDTKQFVTWHRCYSDTVSGTAIGLAIAAARQYLGAVPLESNTEGPDDSTASGPSTDPHSGPSLVIGSSICSPSFLFMPHPEKDDRDQSESNELTSAGRGERSLSAFHTITTVDLLLDLTLLARGTVSLVQPKITPALGMGGSLGGAIGTGLVLLTLGSNPIGWGVGVVAGISLAVGGSFAGRAINSAVFDETVSLDEETRRFFDLDPRQTEATPSQTYEEIERRFRVRVSDRSGDRSWELRCELLLVILCRLLFAEKLNALREITGEIQELIRRDLHDDLVARVEHIKKISAVNQTFLSIAAFASNLQAKIFRRT
mmetsp:Transcript_34536/g.35203  ORF Transcript_34536/g.35203 Transcript_34536/m.35203 type:complete len:486 (-) Transcript_34536:233-1690(-)